jgi:hypothetical protein
MLFSDATFDDKKTIAREAQSILLANGAKSAKKTRVSHGSSRNDSINIHDGLTFNWNSNGTELAIIRWADGDVFTPSRKINAGIYEDLLTASGFIVELQGKNLVIKGKVGA